MRRMILLMTLAAMVLVSMLFVVSASGAHKHPKATAKAQKHPTRTVLIQDFRFKPAHITIKRGTKVRWINKDSAPHTATSFVPPRSFDSGRLGKGQRYSHTFNKAGKKRYLCKIHPHMRGSVVVKR
jgi:plastocyanin